MIKINLLPAEDVKKQSQANIIILGSVAGGVVLILIALLFIVRVHAKNSLKKDVDIAQRELKKYQSIANEVDALQQKKGLLEQRRNIIRSLIAGRLTYPKLMDTFIASIPKGIWVSNIQTKSVNEGLVTLNITASSFSNFAIADWISTMEDSKSFSKVELGTISTTEKPDPKNSKKKQIILNFTLTCEYRRI